jgi:hypothetical protein
MQKKITAKADPNPVHANGCMYGMQKWMLVNACGYLQERYAFCNIQHAKKNLLTALHDASASHREKCIPPESFQNTCLSLIPYKMDAKIHAPLEREFRPRYTYGYAKCICMPICTVDWAQSKTIRSPII